MVAPFAALAIRSRLTMRLVDPNDLANKAVLAVLGFLTGLITFSVGLTVRTHRRFGAHPALRILDLLGVLVIILAAVRHNDAGAEIASYGGVAYLVSLVVVDAVLSNLGDGQGGEVDLQHGPWWQG